MPAKKATTAPNPNRVQAPSDWQDRFIEHRWTPLDELLANPMNWRIHPGPQQELIAESLKLLGWLQGVRVNVNTGHIFDGHQRVLEAEKGEQSGCPVDYYDLTIEEEQQALATIDAISAMAVADRPKLDELIAALAEDRKAAGKDGLASAPALDAFLSSLQDDRRAARTGDTNGSGRVGADPDREPAVIGTSYENNPTRQIVLHYGADEYTQVLRLLAWAREHYGVDTSTDAVTTTLREAWSEAGSPDLPDARRAED